MEIWVYDFEVFKEDWIVVFKKLNDDRWLVFHNDNDGVRAFMDNEPVLVGFNVKHYDKYILMAVLEGALPSTVKKVNDYIIGGGQGWECPVLEGVYHKILQYDLMDDCQKGLSLKAIEGHMGMDIRESTVDFTIDRKLTPDEIQESIYYCKHDVLATEALHNLRKDYLDNKVNLGREAGLSTVESLAMTNAKLTAAYLKATKKKHNDERNYVIPDNLKLEYIPPDVIDFFSRLHDPEVSDEECFSNKLNSMLGDCPITVGFGGIHGGMKQFVEVADENN